MINNVKPQAYRWSRATYVMVAGTIAELYRDTDSPTIWDVVAKFSAAFRVDNPRFDNDRFRTAALAYWVDCKDCFKVHAISDGCADVEKEAHNV